MLGLNQLHFLSLLLQLLLQKPVFQLNLVHLRSHLLVLAFRLFNPLLNALSDAVELTRKLARVTAQPSPEGDRVSKLGLWDDTQTRVISTVIYGVAKVASAAQMKSCS